jgi:hypothetical protein
VLEVLAITSCIHIPPVSTMQRGPVPLHGFERDINSLIDAFALQVSNACLQALKMMPLVGALRRYV